MSKFTGYMLTNNNRKLASGQSWWPTPTTLWICKTKRQARKILESMQDPKSKKSIIAWTDIYKVSANSDYVTKRGGLYWTNAPVKAVRRIKSFKLPENIQVMLNAKAMIENGFLKKLNAAAQNIELPTYERGLTKDQLLKNTEYVLSTMNGHGRGKGE